MNRELVASALLVFMADSLGNLTVLRLLPGALVALGSLPEDVLLELVDGCDDNNQQEVNDETD